MRTIVGMDDADRFIVVLRDAGLPVRLEQVPGGQWEVSIEIEEGRTHFARANTRKAAVDYAGQTLLPMVIAWLIAGVARRASGSPDRGILLEGTSGLQTIKRTDAETFGGWGWHVRFRREPDGSLSWGVFDEKTGVGLTSGIAHNWDDAKLNAVLELLPPNLFEAGGAE